MKTCHGKKQNKRIYGYKVSSTENTRKNASIWREREKHTQEITAKKTKQYREKATKTKPKIHEMTRINIQLFNNNSEY